MSTDHSGGGSSSSNAATTTLPQQSANQDTMNYAKRRDALDQIGVFKTFVDQPLPLLEGDDAYDMPRNTPQALANAKVKQIQFGMLKAEDVLRTSHLEIVQRNFYELNRLEPMPFGVLDRRLGISDKSSKCHTCHKPLQDCIGHFGHIALELPVFHIGYMKEIQRVLQTICKTCSRVLLPSEAFREHYLSKMATGDRRGRSATLREEVLDLAKKCRVCSNCGSRNGPVKKLPGMFKFVHDLREKESKKERDPEKEAELKEAARLRRKARAKGLDVTSTKYEEEVQSVSGKHRGAPDSWREQFRLSFENACRYNNNLPDLIDKAMVEISPLLAQRLFSAVSDEDCYLLNLDPAIGRPEDMIVTHLTVPPVCIRPSVTMGSSGSNEDDLTVKLGDIVYINNFIKACFQKGVATPVIIENWDYLQQQVAMLVNSDLPGFNKAAIAAKPIRALTQRLKGKQGRFRGNLSGKRVDFSSRTVISPDPNLRVDQIGVPQRVAKILTFPERVFSHNIAELRQAVLNGPDNHPGANIIEFKTGNKIFLKFADRKFMAAMLREGDIVERHLRDDDVVLFNRQPSLHRMSIMAHRVKVLPWRTFRFNECVCTPYNADFDGDEMNCHLPQTLEARAEAQELMAVTKNIVSPRHGEPLITATQDFITSSFLITKKDRFFDRGRFTAIVAGMNDGLESVLMPPPAIIKPMQLWTGKQIFSLLLKPNRDPSQHWPVITIELKSRSNKQPHPMCPADGYVVIRNSEVMCGSIDKDALGGSKKGMFYQLVRGIQGPVNAARFLNRLAKLSARFVGCQGFSIGIDDVTPGVKLLARKMELVRAGYDKCNRNIELYKRHQLTLRPGCNEEQTLESLLLGELSNIREDAGSVCFKELNLETNTPLIMAVSGSKGSKINISQMTSCVGQQAISGSRIPEGFQNRTLPHFPRYSREPDAKGFVENSFYSGLTATEFFFHTMGGREGLVDTAVKTAETGYMQRRLMKALEDLCVQYDGTVRTSERNLVQFMYGDDGLDPILMAEGSSPVNFRLFFEQCRAIYSTVEVHYGQDQRSGRDISSNVTVTDILLTLNADVRKALRIGAVEDWVAAARVREDPSAAMTDGPASTTVIKSEAQPAKGRGRKKATASSSADSTEMVSSPTTSHGNIIVHNGITLFQPSDLEVLYPRDVELAVRAFLDHPAVANTCTTRFLQSLETFFRDELRALTDLMDQLKIDYEPPQFLQEERGAGISANLSGSRSSLQRPSEEVEFIWKQCRQIYRGQLNCFLNGCFAKYTAAMIEPGTAVGAIGAQSIGEPGTQMTLKTFHFAGVASMNITLGVPRIKEIINASKRINTPIITAPLVCDNDVKSARIVKGRIETTRLGDVSRAIEAILRPGNCFVRILLDRETIDNLQLSLPVSQVVYALESARKLKLKGCIKVRGQDILTIHPNVSASDSTLLQHLQHLKREVANVVVAGIPSVSRAVINDDGNKRYNLLVEGYDLLGVMGTVGVKGTEATSNHIIEVWKTLGIEAARATIIKEIQTTMESHGLNLDHRHIALLADTMTYRGEILGITRFGIAKMKESVLMLASFEKTADHLFEAALRGATDDISGVSECIIMGTPMPVGTGLFALTQNTCDRPYQPDVGTNEDSKKPIYRGSQKYQKKFMKLQPPAVVARQDAFSTRMPMLNKYLASYAK